MTKIEEPAPEGFLYRIWSEDGFGGRPLKTVDGRHVELRFRGSRNYDAGPDFLDAVITLDDRTVRGDVEVHPVADDWYSHKHHQDPRYNRVVLHVVTMDCPAHFKTVRQDGQQVPTLNLDQFLETPAEDLAQEADEVDLRRQVRQGQCALASKHGNYIRQVLEEMGDTRLAMKAERFTEQRSNDSWDQIVYQALLEALGYSKNQIPFRNLAKLLPVESLWNYLWKDEAETAAHRCEAYLFGAAGLLPSQDISGRKIIAEEDVKSYARDLERLWDDFPEKRKIDPLPTESWQFFRLRPQNFPTRRMVAASRLVVRFMEDGFLGDLSKIIMNLERDPKATVKELAKKFVVAAKGFWRDHFSFDESHLVTKPSDSTKLVGQDRASDIVVNVVFPVLIAYANETEDGRLRNAALETFARYPKLSENIITRAMQHMIFGDEDTSNEWVLGARHQQGLIHLQKFVCVPEDCDGCLEM